MADEASIQKMLISITEYERLKDIEQKYIELHQKKNIGKKLHLKLHNYHYRQYRISAVLQIPGIYHRHQSLLLIS
jgi:hypothetical protein